MRYKDHGQPRKRKREGRKPWKKLKEGAAANAIRHLRMVEPGELLPLTQRRGKGEERKKAA